MPGRAARRRPAAAKSDGQYGQGAGPVTLHEVMASSSRLESGPYNSMRGTWRRITRFGPCFAAIPHGRPPSDTGCPMLPSGPGPVESGDREPGSRILGLDGIRPRFRKMLEHAVDSRYPEAGGLPIMQESGLREAQAERLRGLVDRLLAGDLLLPEAKAIRTELLSLFGALEAGCERV